MAHEYCTLDQVRIYGSGGQNPSGSLKETWKDDQVITDALEPYSRAIDNECQWVSFLTTAVVDQQIVKTTGAQSKISVDQSGYLWVKTKFPTIQSVSAMSFKQLPSQSWQTVNIDNVLLETLDASEVPTGMSNQIGIGPDAGIGWLAMRNLPFFLKISFVGGYAELPAAIGRACAEWIWEDYKLREYMPTMAAGFIGMPLTQLKPSQIPPHILQIIKQYKRTAA